MRVRGGVSSGLAARMGLQGKGKSNGMGQSAVSTAGTLAGGRLVYCSRKCCSAHAALLGDVGVQRIRLAR